VEEKPNNNFPIYLNVCYITQNIQIFLQWVFVSEMPCNPQTYGVWARYTATADATLTWKTMLGAKAHGIEILLS
jgi:hypothetical protein